MDLKSQNQSKQVVRVSLPWLFLGVAIMIFLGMGGGILAAQIWSPGIMPLVVDKDDNRLVSTVQEVTISPNLAASQILEAAQRSVVLIGLQSRAGVAVATGFVVTNDGLLVTAGELPAENLVAYDYQGKATGLELVGQDELFGLVYLRARDAVLIPLDMRGETVPVAHELLAVSRSLPALHPQAEFFRVNENILPPELMPAGIQQIMRGTQLSEAALVGSPLMDDEGLVAGILINPPAGLALPTAHLTESLDRVTGGQRELNRVNELGLDLHYTFSTVGESGDRQFAAQVQAVAPNTVAAAAGVKRGDIIWQIGDSPIKWENSILSSLSQDLPIKLWVDRAGQQVEIVLRDLNENSN